MGTEISLDVCGLSVDHSKNSRGSDHGALFQPGDRRRITSDQIDYAYFDERGEAPGAMEDAFGRPLGTMTPRLELLGFTLATAQREYEQVAKAWYENSMAAGEAPAPQQPMSFDEFRAFVVEHAIADMDDTYRESADEREVRGRFDSDPRIARLPNTSWDRYEGYSERSHFGGLINFLHPYSVLRLLAENKRNCTSDVVWQYGPLVEAGWAAGTDFVPGARRAQTFMIATEGSSDAHILRHAFMLLHPDCADFFRFIDVSDRHPFPGTGNLVKFAEGLAKIDVQNQMVFVLDNDAEGFDAYRRIEAMTLPSNMRAMVLPELSEFREFRTKGPDGLHTADVNRRGAAIECYLDLRHADCPPPMVVWTLYKAESDLYQGALERKEIYARAFMRQSAQSVGNGAYDTSKLQRVLESLMATCTAIASASEPQSERARDD